jgi:hypothetical protein
LPFEDGADLNYVYPQALAKQLAPYSSTSVWSTYDVEIAINHDAYMNSTDLDQAVKQGWNGTGTPLNGKYWLFVSKHFIHCILFYYMYTKCWLSRMKVHKASNLIRLISDTLYYMN